MARDLTTPGKRTRNLFRPGDTKPFKLSRSKIEDFQRCPRCFYLDRRLGVAAPSGPPFTLNLAVDHLLKQEFDIHRADGTAHPLMKRYGVDAVPLDHADIDKWRQNFVGVQYLHQPTNLLITGAVDDVWVNPPGSLIVVDYKATATDKAINLNDGTVYKEGYKRQLEIYQWLLRRNGHQVSDTGYFVYANGRRDRKAFDGKLEFNIQLIEHVGDDSWVEEAIEQARACLMADGLPAPTTGCEFCQYRAASKEAEQE